MGVVIGFSYDDISELFAGRFSPDELIIGSGNVGLIGAYHALQAGIEVAAIVEIAPKINGYKVHADKIRRMGVPIYLSTTVISAEGNGKVERVTVAQVDEKWNPILETARTYEVDTLLVAVGLSSADELFTLADQYKFNVMKTGDCDEIAEASSAMFGGKITGRKMAAALGKTDAAIDESWLKKAAVLKSRPGNTKEIEKPVITAKFQPKPQSALKKRSNSKAKPELSWIRLTSTENASAAECA